MNELQGNRNDPQRLQHLEPCRLSIRGVFHRKPQTQVVPNGRAKQRQSFCRKKDDGAVFVFVA